MTREEALNAVKANVESGTLVKQILAAEALMRTLARKLGGDEDEWGLTGLLYDIDAELVQDDPSSHGRLSADIAGDLGASAAVVHAILCQNEAHSITPETKLDKALYCADPLCELITAAALVHPGEVESLTDREVLRHFREEDFNPRINRQQMATCRELGLELEEFISLGVGATQNIIP